jgi:hypothetical protein
VPGNLKGIPTPALLTPGALTSQSNSVDHAEIDINLADIASVPDGLNSCRTNYVCIFVVLFHVQQGSKKNYISNGPNGTILCNKSTATIGMV